MSQDVLIMTLQDGPILTYGMIPHPGIPLDVPSEPESLPQTINPLNLEKHNNHLVITLPVLCASISTRTEGTWLCLK